MILYLQFSEHCKTETDGGSSATAGSEDIAIELLRLINMFAKISTHARLHFTLYCFVTFGYSNLKN